MIPLSVPSLEKSAWKYVKECLDTGWVSSAGPFVGRFEEKTARFTGAGHAVAAVNGTAALHAALRLAGAGPGVDVLVPALTFIATANAASYTGARLVFVDCEPNRFNMDLGLLDAALAARPRGRKAVVMATHILGYPMDMKRTLEIAKRRGAVVVEDAAESIGSYWAGRHTGTWGLAGALSFNGNKIITTGGGGMLLTGDRALARRAKHLTQQAKLDGIEYVHDEIGWNYRLTNILAALGVSQMESLPGFLRRRKTISSWYASRLKGLAPIEPVEKKAVWNRWLLAVQTPDLAGRDRLLADFEKAGVQARPLWRPVPLQKPYARAKASIPEATLAYRTVVNIPSSTSLTERDVETVCRVLRGRALTRLLI
ncbi:MAG: aminotransferase class I/II-fold pyridoxal phosphate-dependent enzyme [Elusimicrobiota bacterium]|nr:MAG: aminotransferase class I/II-fold pyridoxal phosphate-dependent enzyme [Elusimicrobiota bacterium]